jgi:hypothetical protein
MGFRYRRANILESRTRFVFYTELDATASLRLANASGGSSVVLDSTKPGTSALSCT